MKSRKLIVVAVLLVVTLVACERTSREYAAKSANVAGSPAYQENAVAHVFAVAGDTFVRDVLPQGDEAPDGQALYAKSCLACHQVTGQGIVGTFPPLADSYFVTSDKTDRLAAIMIYGLQGPITVKGVDYNMVMTPWGGMLKDAELAAVATYIRNSWGNSAAAVSPEVFAKVRAEHGTRGPFTIQELGVDP